MVHGWNSNAQEAEAEQWVSSRPFWSTKGGTVTNIHIHLKQ